MSAHLVATMAAQALPPPYEGAAVPEWVHLLPAGEIRTHDGRGPYRLADAEAVVAASMGRRSKLVIDENHATDLAAPHGREAPARGRILAMEARPDGIWGRVEWNAVGRSLLADDAYDGLSPVIEHDKGGRVLRILRASLVNEPNLRGLAALHAEEQGSMDWTKVVEALGLGADATPDDAVAKVETLKGEAAAPALQSALTEIGAALGVEGDGAAVVAAAKAARAGVGDVVALQSQLATAQAEVKSLRDAQVRAASEAYVDAEMAKGRAGLNAQTRPDLVSLHMSQPEAAARIIESMPVLGGAAPKREGPPPGAQGGVLSLNAEQADAARALGIAPADYLKTLQAEANQ